MWIIGSTSLLVFVLLVLLFFHERLKRALLYPGRRFLPGPGRFAFPILGHLGYLDPRKPYLTLTKFAHEGGKIYGLSLGSIYTVVIADSKLMSSALTKSELTGRAPLYLTHGIMKGYGIICAEGDLWRVHRKFISRTLNSLGAGRARTSRRGDMQQLVLSSARDFISGIFENCHDQVAGVDFFVELQHSIGNLMFELVMGKSWDKNDSTWRWLQKLQEEGTKAIGVSGPLNFFPILRHLPSYKKLMEGILDGKHKTHLIYRGIIDEQVEACKNTMHEEGWLPKNFAQAFAHDRKLVENDPKLASLFDDHQLFHLLADIFGAGLDTSVATLSWFILYMASNPHYQSEILQEIEEVLGDETPDYDEHTRQMPFTWACLHEAQRIRSVIPTGIPHATTEDVELFGYFVPKGSMIMPLQWAMHMDPDVWDEPETYNPRRFIDAEGRLNKPSTFVPFQSGKRMCIGDDVANMILFLFSISLLRTFRILPVEGVEIDLEGELGITFTPKHQNLVFVPLKKPTS